MFDLPITKPQSMPFEAFMEHMAIDKKVLAGQLRFILPIGIGHAEVISGIKDDMLKRAIEDH